MRPSIETLKTLEAAEIAQGSSDPRPSKRARKSAPKQLGATQGLEARIGSAKGKETAIDDEVVSLSLGAKGNIPSGYIVSSLWVLKQFTQLIPSG